MNTTASLEATIPPQFAGIVNRLTAEGASRGEMQQLADQGPLRTQHSGMTPKGDSEAGSDFSSPQFRGSPSGEHVPPSPAELPLLNWLVPTIPEDSVASRAVEATEHSPRTDLTPNSQTATMLSRLASSASEELSAPVAVDETATGSNFLSSVVPTETTGAKVAPPLASEPGPLRPLL